MGVLKTRVIWYPNQGRGVPVEIDDFVNINIKMGTDGKSNVTDVDLKNPFGAYNDSLDVVSFNEKDVVKIFAKLEENDTDINISSSTNLLTITNIQEWNGLVDNKSTTYKLKCIDRTYQLLNKVWSSSYINKSSPFIIKNVVQSVTEIPSGVPSEFYYTSGNKNYYIDSWTYVDSVRPNSSAFPDEVNVGMSFKPIYEWITNMSQVENTNFVSEINSNSQVCTKPYIFYVDELNKLHWNYPSSTINYYFEEGKQKDSIDYSKSAYSVRITSSNTTSSSTNKIICTSLNFTTLGVTSGMYVNIPSLSADLSWAKITSVDSSTQLTLDKTINIGSGISFTIYPSVSADIFNINITKATFDVVNFIIFQAGKDMYDYGILYYKYDENSNSKDFKMVYKEWPKIAQSLLSRDYNEGLDASGRKNGGGTYDKPEFPSSYPYTPIWTTNAVNSDSAYNTSLRDAAKKIGIANSENLIARFGNPRYKGKVTITGLKLNPGILVKFTSSSLGMYNLSLRVKDITHNINQNSWTTTLDLEEDNK